jgi:N-acetylglucosaminyldiphosphoundecaprenol N-acetyl-beta-D-mannosaminyltransferase
MMIRDFPVAAAVPLEVFDTSVTPMTPSDVIAFVEDSVLADRVTVVANHNLHSLYLLQENPEFASFYANADAILIDGFPVLLAAKRSAKSQGLEPELTSLHRVGSLDWVLDVGLIGTVQRVALVGASPEANERAVERLRTQHPHLVVTGWDGQGWNSAKEAAVVKDLGSFGAQITLVALGMPLQESLIMRNRGILPPGVYATVGGALDQLAGIQKGAPRWLGRFGLEWLWRFATQPRRLFHRYMIEPWKLLFFVTKRVASNRSGK